MKPEAEGEGWLLYGQPTNMIARSAIEKVRTLPTVKDASPYLMFRFRNPVDGTGLVLGGFDPQSKSAVGTTCCAATDIVGGHFLAPDEEGAVMIEEAYAAAKGLCSGGTIRIGAAVFGTGVAGAGLFGTGGLGLGGLDPGVLAAGVLAACVLALGGLGLRDP
jgi:putative ABC transport system permease protein